MVTKVAVEAAWPVKQRELIKYVIDSRNWNGFEFRDDDVVIGTWSKSGTTWMQQIVGQLILGPDPELSGQDRSPWPDFRLREGEAERAAGQTHRRYLKTHLPIESLVYSPKAKYIYIGRDGRDAYWSWYNHQNSFKQEILNRISSFYPDQPPATHPDPDIRKAFHLWLELDGEPNWPFWSHVQGWFDARRLPNLMLVHFNDLKADLPGQIRAIAEFLEIELAEAQLSEVASYCSFDHMRRLASREGAHTSFKGGGSSFIYKGTNGRWHDVLTKDDLARYQDEVEKHLSPDAARWLETGKLPTTH